MKADEPGLYWPNNMGKQRDIEGPPKAKGIPVYPDNHRVRYPVRVPEELYNDRDLGKVTILVMLSAFHGMNIPTLLNKLSADFDSNLMHEAYEDACKEHKEGGWTNKEWHKYGQECLHYHMESSVPHMGPACLKQ